jgi:hypothetical protein
MFRVVQRGGGFRFPLKTAKRLRISGDLVGKKFEGYETAELGVLGLVSYTHPAVADFFDDAVMRNDPSGEGSRIRHGVASLGWPTLSSQRTGAAALTKLERWAASYVTHLSCAERSGVGEANCYRPETRAIAPRENPSLHPMRWDKRRSPCSRASASKRPRPSRKRPPAAASRPIS